MYLVYLVASSHNNNSKKVNDIDIDIDIELAICNIRYDSINNESGNGPGETVLSCFASYNVVWTRVLVFLLTNF